MPRFFFDIPQFLETIMDEDEIKDSVNEALKFVSLFEQPEIAHMIEALDMEYPEIETQIWKESRANGKRRNPNAVGDQFGEYSGENLRQICRSLFCALQICRVRICRLNKIASIKKRLEDTLIATVHRLKESVTETARLRSEAQIYDGGHSPASARRHLKATPSDPITSDRGRTQTRHRYVSSSPERTSSSPQRRPSPNGRNPRRPGKPESSSRSASDRPPQKKTDALQNVRAAARAKIGVRGFMQRIQRKKSERERVLQTGASPRSPPPAPNPTPTTQRGSGTRTPRSDASGEMTANSSDGVPEQTEAGDVVNRIQSVLDRAEKIVELRKTAESNQRQIAQRSQDIENMLEEAPPEEFDSQFDGFEEAQDERF